MTRDGISYALATFVRPAAAPATRALTVQCERANLIFAKWARSTEVGQRQDGAGYFSEIRTLPVPSSPFSGITSVMTPFASAAGISNAVAMLLVIPG